MRTKQLTDRMDKLFERLDSAKFIPDTMLKSAAHKKHHETKVMFAFRKLQAAQYHLHRVDELSRLQVKELAQMEADSAWTGDDPMGPITTTTRVTASANEYAFELCAFFAAIRSAIDFLANLCGEHIKGKEFDGLRTFLKLVKNGDNDPIVSVFATHAEWLVRLHEYRDYVVHRLVIRTSSGRQVQWEQGKAATVQFPVIVPSTTPTNVPDTREARFHEQHDAHFTISTSRESTTDANGEERLLTHTATIEPADGYIRIESLMKRELATFETFFADILDVLLKLDFAFTPAAKHS